MAARVVEVADACVARLRAAWPEAVAAVTTAERRWQFRAPDPERGLRSVDGRRVYVVPAGYADGEPVTRASDEHDYRVLVLVVRRYDGAGDPPDDWVDAEAALVEQHVFKLLNDQRAPDLPLPGGGSCSPQEGEVVVVCDLDVLAEDGAFWSEIEFTFREIA